MQVPALRILVAVSPAGRSEIARKLAPLKAEMLFATDVAEAAAAIHEGDLFQVALLAARLSDTDWRELWGLLALLDRRPALLVYTHEPSFELWTEVLDSGGYDVIAESFSDEQLQQAVRRAAKSFERGSLDGFET